MKPLNERQNKILRMLVNDFITSAKPIGSSKLVKRHKMACSSATVRNDMSLLEELGLLRQSHVSSGRTPTDLGYRYYVDNLMRLKDIPPRFRRRILNAFRSLDSSKYSLAVRMLADELSSLTGNLTVVSIPPDRLETSGVRYLLRHPEFLDVELVKKLGFVIDHLDIIMFGIRDRMEIGSYKVFIAQELGYDYTKSMAIAVRKFRDPFGEDHVIGSIGPVRMNYNQLPNLMSFATEVLENF